MGRRRRAREYALQILFQLDLSGGALEDVLASFWEDAGSDDVAREFCERIVHGVRRHGEPIDATIDEAAEHWRVARMPTVDRNVLRVAIYELMYEPEVPAPVAIDEAIEVAKKYGSEDSGGFINGVLDAVRKGLDSGRIRPAGPTR